MTTTSEIGVNPALFSKPNTGNAIQQLISPLLPQFDQILRSYVLFNIFFFSLGFVEVLLLLLFFTFLTQSAILAFSLAVVFLTFFSYFILRLYYQAQKPEQLHEFRERYLRACKSILHYQEGSPEHYMGLANAAGKLSDALAGREYALFQLPAFLSFAQPYIERFSYWYHWQDVHQMRELLLKSAVAENIKLVKHDPTSLEAHASLANAYILMSALYAPPNHNEKTDEEQWLPDEAFSEESKKKFRWTAERAVEEFKIINDFAPDDPWVHAQLAYSYHDLQMPLEEIKEYEILLKLDPEDPDTLLRLGILYFQQGMNAKGLCMYEELKTLDERKSEELLKFYGAYSQKF